jgi:hypothetical protein
MLWAVEMSTNGLYRFDLKANGKTIPGKRLGDLPAESGGKKRQTDCLAMCVGPDDMGGGNGARRRRRPAAAPGELPPGAEGAARPRGAGGGEPEFHEVHRRERQAEALPPQDGEVEGLHAVAVASDGRLRDGSVCVMTIGPFTLLRFTMDRLE